MLSRLHVEGAENGLRVRSGAPPEVALCGKLAVLDRVLACLKRAGHRVRWLRGGVVEERESVVPDLWEI